VGHDGYRWRAWPYSDELSRRLLDDDDGAIRGHGTIFTGDNGRSIDAAITRSVGSSAIRCPVGAAVPATEPTATATRTETRIVEARSSAMRTNKGWSIRELLPGKQLPRELLSRKLVWELCRWKGADNRRRDMRLHTEVGDSALNRRLSHRHR